MTIITNRLSGISKEGRKLTKTKKERYGSYEMLRYISDEPIYPVGYVQHKIPMSNEVLGVDREHFFRRCIIKDLPKVSEKRFSYSGKIWSSRVIILRFKPLAMSTKKKRWRQSSCKAEIFSGTT